MNQVILMTRDEAEMLVTEINTGIATIGEKLLALYEREGWRALGYSSWRECAMVEFNFQRGHVYRLLNFAKVERNLSESPMGDNLPLPESERQARPLTKLPPEDQPVAWQEAVETAPDGKVTAAHVEATVKQFNYKRDQRSSHPANIYIPQGQDACQTPAYAIDPLFDYLADGWTIWEPAAGEGYLVEAFYDGGFPVVDSDILTDQNFFEYEPDDWHCLVTNPPFSIKFEWLRRCYELGKPFALLLPVETLGAKTAQDLFESHGIEIILLNRRVNFKMPNKGWGGGGAQFPVAWFTWGLNIGKQISFGRIEYND